nr:E3 binding domain-containing protein [Actinomycetota bacterium]
MAVSVTMPRLGESVSEGTVTRWLKKEGERVEADEPLLEVSTDKVDTEIPAPAGGIVSSIKVQEDETVEVGVELATIDDGGAEATPAAEPEPQTAPEPAAAAPEPAAQPQAAPEANAPEPEAEPETSAAATPEPAPAAAPEAPAAKAQPAAPASRPAAPETAGPAPSGSDGGEGTYVTPLVRKLATEHGVDLSSLSGTGVGGRIRKQDVLDAAEQGQGAPPGASAPAAEPAASPQLPQPAADKPTSAPAPVYVDQAAQA